MFDIGFFELLIILVIFLLGIKPERFPEIAKAFIKKSQSLKSSLSKLKDDFEKDIGLEELKQDLHNESILENLKKKTSNVKKTVEKDGK